MVCFRLLSCLGVLLLAPLVRVIAQATPPPGASGRVVSGEGAKAQPISGSRVQLWAQLNTSIGAPVAPLIARTVLTDSNGYFSIEGQFKCPTPETLVFFTAIGGSPGLPHGAQNPLIGLETAIGACSKLTPTTFTTINELTTIAAAVTELDVTEPGQLVGWDPQNASFYQGLFQQANWLVNPTTGTSPGTGAPAQVTIPTAELNTAANILATCVKSTGNNQDPASTCLTLFQAVSNQALFPSSTLTVAYNLPFSPPSLLFYFGNPGPFQPTLATAPAVWAFGPEATNVTATPVITVTPGGRTPGPQTITITDATPGAVIYYLFSNAVSPRAGVYTGPITVDTYTSLSATAVAPGRLFSQSANAMVATQFSQLAAPTFLPPAGTYYGPVRLHISDPAPGPTDIYYTTDGSTPTMSSKMISFYEPLTADTTVKAIAFDASWQGYGASPVATADYTIYQPLASPPSFSPGGDTYTGPQTVTISAPGAVTIYYTTDGSKPTLSSAVYTSAISVTTSETINVLAIGSGGNSNRSVAAASYIIAKPGNYGTIRSLRMPILLTPAGVTVDAADDLDIADSGHFTIWELTPPGAVEKLAGSISLGNLSGDGGPATAAGVSPYGLVTDAAGDLYFTDLLDSGVRKIAANTGLITTIAGFATSQSDPNDDLYSGDGGPATAARLNRPTAITLGPQGDVYIADTFNNRVRRIDLKTGVITTVAGGFATGLSGDGGLATNAALNQPMGIAFDRAGNLFISDSGNARVRRVDAATGVITTVAGQSDDVQFRGDNGPALAAYLGPTAGIAFDAAGNLFVITGNTVRRIAMTTGVITTVVGGGANAPTTGVGDYVYATDGVLNGPTALAFDRAGALYIADLGNNRVRKVVF